MLALIVLLAMLYNSPHMLEISVINCWNVEYAEKSIDVCPTDLRQSQVISLFILEHRKSKKKMAAQASGPVCNICFHMWTEERIGMRPMMCFLFASEKYAKILRR